MLLSGRRFGHGESHGADRFLHPQGRPAGKPALSGALKAPSTPPRRALAAAAQGPGGRGRRHHQPPPAKAARLSGKEATRARRVVRRSGRRGRQSPRQSRMQGPAGVVPAPVHQARDEDHGENDRQGP